MDSRAVHTNPSRSPRGNSAYRQNVYRRSSVDVVGTRCCSNQTEVVHCLDIYPAGPTPRVFQHAKKKSLQLAQIRLVRVHKTYHFPSNTFFLLPITSRRYTSHTALSTTPHHTPSVRCAPPNYTYSPEPVAFSGHLPAWQTQTEIHPVPLHQRLGACCGNTQPCAWSTHSMDCRQTCEIPSRRVGTVGLSKNQLRKWFDLRASEITRHFTVRAHLRVLLHLV